MAGENSTETNGAPEVDASAQIEQSVSAALDAFNTKTDDNAPADADTAEEVVEGVADADDAEDDAEGADAADAEDNADDAPEGDDPDAGEQQSNDGAPTLPAAHIRSLKAYGWSDDEIAELQESPLAATTAAKIHAQRTRDIQQWANHGRQQAAQATDAAANPPAKAGGVPEKLDIAALREKYGDSDLLDEIVAPINAKLDLINQLLPDLQSGQAVAQQARFEAAKTQVDSFFTSGSMKPYENAYGTSTDSLTDEQKGNRVKLLQTADYIRTGASAQGQEIPIHEAMGMAHEIVGGGFRAEAVRKEIRSQVTQRAKGASLRPGTQISSKKLSTAATQEQVISNAAARLASLGN